jgi:hypothetical protein
VLGKATAFATEAFTRCSRPGKKRDPMKLRSTSNEQAYKDMKKNLTGFFIFLVPTLPCSPLSLRQSNLIPKVCEPCLESPTLPVDSASFDFLKGTPKEEEPFIRRRAH